MMTLLDDRTSDDTAPRSTVVTRVVVPGAGTLEFERDRATSTLLGITGGGRRYLTIDADTGTWEWHGVCLSREQRRPDGMTRDVTTPAMAWTEHYRWEDDRLVEVDGVSIRRDELGRVVACLPGGDDPAPSSHRWFYGHSDRGLAHVDGPFGLRTISLDGAGRPGSVHDDGVTRRIEHDADGHRRGPGRQLHHHVDESGRWWATGSRDGRVDHVYLWDGTRCLARIDGGVGAPLAAVFSLDPSATPVRIVRADGTCVRVPRDAYGEGLLAHRDVPGLFGGQVHGGLVHLPLRRLDPITGTFCEPDPLDGADADPRREGHRHGYEGPLPVEPDPRSAYEVCRGDPIGRGDPSGGISAGLVISDLTWSLQNNLLAFFGIDWWFNLFMSLIMAPVDKFQYDFFDSTGLVASERHGAFGVRRDGFIPGMITAAMGSPRAFATQHIVWAPDVEFSVLDVGEVIDCGRFEPTHYGSILAITPDGQPGSLLQSMDVSSRTWVGSTSADGWTRHGGVGEPVAPGTLTPWFPTGGIHLDTARLDTRGDTSCRIDELVPNTVAAGDLEDRSFLTAPSPTGLADGDRVLIADSTNLAMASVIGLLRVAGAERVQLDADLGPMADSGLSVTQVSATPVSSESRAVGPVADSIDVLGTAETYARNDLVRLASGNDVTVARIARLEARVPIDRPLPAGFTGPIALATGAVAGAARVVTLAGANLDFGTGTRPAVGAVGVVTGGGSDVAVRVEAHAGTSEVELDMALPAAITSAASITFRSVNAGATIGRRDGDAEADPFVTYTPDVAGAAPDGTGGLAVLHCHAGGVAHARIVTGPPVHDVAVLDRAIVGSSPFTIERYTTVGSTTSGLTRADVMALVLPDPAPFADAPAVFLTRVTGEPPDAARVPDNVIVNGDVRAGSLSVPDLSALPVDPPGASPPTGRAGLEPGRPVVIGTRPAAVRTIRATPTFDRTMELGDGELRLVGLEGVGHAYVATAHGTDEVVVEPVADRAGTRHSVPFPRFEPGDLVRVTDTGGGNETWHRVDTVTGGRIALGAGPSPTAGPDLLVQAVATTDPVAGGPFLGIAGERGASGPTDTATFSVWSTDAVARGNAVGIVDGDVTHPAVVAAGAIPGVVTFSESFDAVGADVAILDRVDDRFVATLGRDGGALLLDGGAGTLETQPGESIVAIAYTVGDVTTSGTIAPGAFLVPEGETTEVSRAQALTDHELTHTHQYAKWGPLWFCLFPMLAMELPGILATDTELPEYSAFLDGTLTVGDGSRWDIALTSTGGVSLSNGDTLQVVQGSRHARVTIAQVAGTTLSVTSDGGGALPTGQVSVRKLQRDSVFDVFFAIFDLMTHGGLLNVIAGSTWGGIFWLLGKGFYGLGRAIGGTGDLYPATVQDGGGAVTLTNAGDTDHIRAEGRVVVRQGDNTVIRSMTRSETIITLSESLAFTGDVQVAMYDTHDPGSAFDWYDYFPATVDADNHFSITVGQAGDDTLGLDPEDRVQIRYRNTDFKTDVLAVDGATVELSDRIQVVDGELSLRIAKVGASDPLGNADSAAMVEMGMGWMKWLFDPYGQIEYAAAPDEEWARWLLRVMRWIVGTQNFSLLPFGYGWWFRLFRESRAHTMFVEQQASQESGDLYSALGRMYGQVDDNGWAAKRMVVGDVARYRYWPLDRDERGVAPTRLDRTTEPNATPENYASEIRTMPNRDLAGAGTDPPNLAVETSGADPGTFVAETFTERDSGAVDPNAVPGGDPLGFDTSVLGTVPVGPRTEKMQSTYVAFTRPGTHRVTTINNVGGFDAVTGVPFAQRAVDAFDVGGQGAFRGGQTLFYDVTVDDVTVTVAGIELAEGDGIELVPFQRAAVGVTPNTARAYRVAVPDPSGPHVSVDRGAIVADATTAGALVPVEVSRFYEVGDDGTYGAGGLALAGRHLSRDLHVPVRRFELEVVDTLPLRADAGPTSAPITSLAAGASGVLLVPAPIVSPPEVVSVNGNPPAAGDADPISRLDAGGAGSFLGAGGAAFTVQFPADAETGPVELRVRVGVGAASTELTCSFDLT